MRTLVFVGLFGVLLSACGLQVTSKEPQKIKGLSLVGSRALPSDSCWQGILDVGATSITLMPYAYMQEGSDTLITQTNWQWEGESFDGIETCIQQAQERSIIPIIKPHLWIGGGAYTGQLSFEDSIARKHWNLQFIEYISGFAKLSEKYKLPYFIFATEMQSMWEDSPEDFLTLIAACRKVYSGKLIYAANWDEYDMLPYWDKIDVMGINAYFPLENAAKARDKWKRHKVYIPTFAKRFSKPVMFTELGYRSIINPFKEPWVSDTDESPNQEAQAEAWRIFFEEVYHEPWLQGVFVWKWFPHHNSRGSENGFTPQGKQAEQVIAEYFNKK